MKPLEIEFLMKDKLTAGLDKSKKSVEQLLGAARQASAEIEKKIEDQRKVIDKVNNNLEKMESKLHTMKPGAGQQQLLEKINACKTVLADETAALDKLDNQHQQAKQTVSQLEQEYGKLANSGNQATIQVKSLKDQIAEQKDVIRRVKADIKDYEKAYKKATSYDAQKKNKAEWEAAKKTLEEEKVRLSYLIEEQRKYEESNRRLALQLRELENRMQKMRLEGKQDSEEYRQMAQDAAKLADTLKDVKNQTSILSNDDANLQGFISGVNGLSGAFTTATGAMSLFASENENLQKVQARLQSVMAITMGLQQVFNTLNKDSAFRLVTVAKAKEFLTTANYRLATALGISNAAASALMATLTLGLSVVITGLIVAWNKYSDAQEEAKRKTEELVEVESKGRAEMIKTRFEIDSTRKSLKNFNGSKEEEKRKCDELNRKYGEAFGYYDSVAKWYDVLTAKAEQYIQMLFLQAKAQALVNKAVEADEKLNKHKAAGPSDAETSMEWYSQMGHYLLGFATLGYHDADAAIRKYNREAYQAKSRELIEKRDNYLNEAAELEKKAEEIAKAGKFGGHSNGNNSKKEQQRFLEQQRKQELERQRQDEDLAFKTRQHEIDIMEDNNEKVLEQIKLDYDKRKAEIRRAYEDLEQEKINAARKIFEANPANKKKAFDPSAVDTSYTEEEKRERKKADEANEKQRLRATEAVYEEEQKSMRDFLKKYGDFQQRKQAIAEDYAERIRKAKTEGERLMLQKEQEEEQNVLRRGMREYLKEYGDELQQELAITEDYQEQIAEARANGNEGMALLLEKNLQKELSNMRLTNLRKSQEYVRAFENLGNTSTQTLQSLIKKFEDAKEAAAQSLDPNQLREYTETLQQMYDELDNRNPFEALTNALKELAKAQKEVKDAKDIYDRVKGGQSVINASTGTAYTESEASELVASAKDRESKAYTKLAKASTDCAKRLDQFADTLNQLGDMVGGKLGDSIGAIGGILGSVSDGFNNIKNINVNAKGFEKSLGQISAVVGTVQAMVEMNRQLDNVLPDAESLYEHYAAKQRQLNEMHMHMVELEIEQLEQRLTSESWFYENGLTQLRKNGELNAQYLKAYGEIASMPQEVYKDAGSGFSKWAPAIIGAIVGIVAGVLTFGAGAGPGAALGAAIGTAIGGTAIGVTLGATVVAAIGTAIFSGVGAALGNAVRAGFDGLTYKEGQTAAIDNLRVQTRHKTFFRSEKTQDLQSWVKENWGQDLFEEVKGVQLIDPEVAKKILDEGPTLVGETRETLEQLLEYSEKIHDFLDDVHEYVSEAFSPLVDNLTDALWDWLANGENVMDKFKEYAADTFKNIAQEALKAMITKNIFEPYQEQLEDLTIAYSTGQISEAEYMAGVAEFSKQLSTSIETQLPVLQTAAQIIDTAFENAGFDIAGNQQQQSGKAGAFTTMSQDQAGKLEGLFVSGQIHWASLDDKMTDVSIQIGAAGDTLKRIEEHTGSSALSLEEIKNDIKILKRDGIKVK